MRIDIKAVDPSVIRYSTCGDWWWNGDGSLQVSVPEYGSRNSSFLVALHELVEAWLCRAAHITEAEVLKWDLDHPDSDEPAEEKGSPYIHQHNTALKVEKIVAKALGIDFGRHDHWVVNAATEVDRHLDSGIPVARITKEGSRYWTELHLFALRVSGENHCHDFWLTEWVKSLPFEGCPCEQHLKDFIRLNPPDWNDFFKWSVDLHNAVNARIGRLTIDVEMAKKMWLDRQF